MTALSHDQWVGTLTQVAHTNEDALTRDLAHFCLELLDVAGDTEAVQDYLTRRAQKALDND